MADTNTDLYARLGVSPDAPVEVIDAAYKALLKRNHPDLAASEEDRNLREQYCRELGEAHATLRDPSDRVRYDASRKERSTTPPGAFSENSAQPGAEESQHHTTQGAPEQYGALHSFSTDATPHHGTQVLDPYGRALPEYDDLDWDSKRRLSSLARIEPAWAQTRRVLMKRRSRIAGVPLAWFGLLGSQDRAKRKATRRELGTAAGVGAVLAALSLLIWRSSAVATFVTTHHPLHWNSPSVRFSILGNVLAVVLLSSLSPLLWWLVVPRFSPWRHGLSRAGAYLAALGVSLVFLPFIALFLPLIIALIWAIVFVIRKLEE